MLNRSLNFFFFTESVIRRQLLGISFLEFLKCEVCEGRNSKSVLVVRIRVELFNLAKVFCENVETPMVVLNRVVGLFMF